MTVVDTAPPPAPDPVQDAFVAISVLLTSVEAGDFYKNRDDDARLLAEAWDGFFLINRQIQKGKAGE